MAAAFQPAAILRRCLRKIIWEGSWEAPLVEGPPARIFRQMQYWRIPGSGSIIPARFLLCRQMKACVMVWSRTASDKGGKKSSPYAFHIMGMRLEAGGKRWQHQSVERTGWLLIPLQLPGPYSALLPYCISSFLIVLVHRFHSIHKRIEQKYDYYDKFCFC